MNGGMIKRMNWDSYERDYILDNGWTIGADGRIEIPKAATKGIRFGKSIRRPELRTLTIPSIHGISLIFEGMHFVVI